MRNQLMLVCVGMVGVGVAFASVAATNRGKPLTQDFMETFAPNHVLDVAEWAGQDRSTYLCPNVEAARKVVAAIPASGKASRKVREKHFTAALGAQHCSEVKTGKFRPTLGFEQRAMSKGESDEVWQALAATDAKGRTVGLVFNTSVF